MTKEDIIFEDLYEEVDEHDAYTYITSHGKINITDYGIWINGIIRAIYWVIPGEVRNYDVKVEDYIKNVRRKKLEKIGI